MFVISILINIGMWYERFNIVVTSLSHNYIPANWAIYSPTIIEIGLFGGDAGNVHRRLSPVFPLHPDDCRVGSEKRSQITTGTRLTQFFIARTDVCPARYSGAQPERANKQTVGGTSPEAPRTKGQTIIKPVER